MSAIITTKDAPPQVGDRIKPQSREGGAEYAPSTVIATDGSDFITLDGPVIYNVVSGPLGAWEYVSRADGSDIERETTQ